MMVFRNIFILLAASWCTLASGATYSEGSGNLLIGLDMDGNIEMKFGLQTGAVVDGVALGTYQEFGQGDLSVLVPDASYGFVEANGGRSTDSAWNPIGVPAGTSFWYLPESSVGAGSASNLPSVLLGFSAASLDPGKWSNLKIILDGAPTSPDGANFSLFTDGAVPQFWMSTVDGVDDTDSFFIAPGASARYSWAFTAPGDYTVNFRILGTFEGNDVEASSTFGFVVVPEPGSAILIGGMALSTLMKRRRVSKIA